MRKVTVAEMGGVMGLEEVMEAAEVMEVEVMQAGTEAIVEVVMQAAMGWEVQPQAPTVEVLAVKQALAAGIQAATG